MGQYNPRAPGVIGEEWVGIRDENTVFSPTVSLTENGHTFTTTVANTLQDARYYINSNPPNLGGFVFVPAIYPADRGAESGPVHVVNIPVESVATTGFTFSGVAGTQVLIMQDPSFGSYFIAAPPTNEIQMTLNFNTAAYQNLLQDKRILNVTLLLGINAIFDPTLSPQPSIRLTDSTVINTGVSYSSVPYRNDNFSIPGSAPERFSFGNVNRMWTAGGSTSEILPWNWTDLARFDASAGSKLYVSIATGSFYGMNTPNDTVYIWYAALEVTYCEEQRLFIGGQALQTSVSKSSFPGANAITMRDIARNLTPSLPPGRYLLTLSAADEGGRSAGSGMIGYPSLNTLRQVEAIPTHRGVQINTTLNEGEVFEDITTDTLLQLSLHTSAGPVTAVHAYGRVTRGQVFGSTYVEQNFLDDYSRAEAYDQIRFYARRYGNTTQPLVVRGVGSGTGTASIAVSDFDNLDEIVDGWKEITLAFDTPPTYGTNVAPTYRWEALGETKGNRWEVLGVAAPAISGTAGNYLSVVAAPQTLEGGTFGSSTYRETWLPQGVTDGYVATPTADTASDVVAIISSALPQITGHAVSQQSQELTTFTECGAGPCCIPTALSYNRVTWNRPTSYVDVVDTFTRVVANGWGNTDTGQAWTLDAGSAADFSVNGSLGIISHTITGSSHFASVPVGSVDQDLTVDWRLPALPTGAGTATMDFFVRMTDTLNGYFVRLVVSSTGAVTLALNRIIAGAISAIAGTSTITLPFTIAAGHWYSVRVSIITNIFRARVWDSELEQPGEFYTATATGAGSGTRTGIATSTSGAPGLPFVFNYDNVRVSLTSSGDFGAYELQRWDQVTDWQTIMRATDKSLAVFNDYEARVDTPSVYRIRIVNELNFNGPWSTQITGTVPEPGVTLPACGASKRGVLIFTSNESQIGAHNLAYAMTWDGSPSETFSFPEADEVIITKQHARDYQIATHGTERGGEVFERRLLLANAAVALPHLANMRDLRDMAWADLPYVCVRDDIGDRWFASVQVTDSRVKRNRRLYNADVTITEVTATASPVDP